MTKPRDYYVRREHGSDRLSVEETLAQERFPIYAILDHIRSAHNVGSVFRTSDGANVAELFLCGYTAKPPHRHLAKTALGASETVPWRGFETVEEAIGAARELGCQVLAFEYEEDSVALYDYPCTFPVAILVGNETNGLTPEVRALCDATVHLPMFGHKSSLNVSVAYGIAVYEIAQRYLASMQQ